MNSCGCKGVVVLNGIEFIAFFIRIEWIHSVEWEFVCTARRYFLLRSSSAAMDGSFNYPLFFHSTQSKPCFCAVLCVLSFHLYQLVLLWIISKTLWNILSLSVANSIRVSWLWDLCGSNPFVANFSCAFAWYFWTVQYDSCAAMRHQFYVTVLMAKIWR